MNRGSITSPHPTRADVLAWMLSQGVEGGSIGGGPTPTGRRWVSGRKVRVRKVVWEYGVWHREARAVLKALVANGLAEYGGRGRHAAWHLTEAGIKAAETPTTAVSQS